MRRCSVGRASRSTTGRSHSLLRNQRPHVTSLSSRSKNSSRRSMRGPGSWLVTSGAASPLMARRSKHLRFHARRLLQTNSRDPPRELENELAQAWRGQMQPAQASQPVFWLLCHIDWLEQDRFGADRLASSFTASAVSLDDQTRTFLRRSGGLPHIRGNISVFSDCPLARSWWRCRIVDAVVDDAGGEISREDAHRVLHDYRPVWETLVRLSLRQITVINQPRARAALVAALIRRDRPGPETVQRIAMALARHGLTRSLQHTPWPELQEIAVHAAD